jgi:hypothetical protein
LCLPPWSSRCWRRALLMARKIHGTSLRSPTLRSHRIGARSHPQPVNLFPTLAPKTIAFGSNGISAIFKAPSHGLPFFSLLLIAIVGSRLKVKLPGLTGNMSVNLPFILLATLQLSLFEALIVSLSSIMAQCYPAKHGNSNGVQSLFNLSTTAVAVAVAALTAHGRIAAFGGTRSEMLGLIAAGATIFVLQTAPVATIISLTEGGQVFQIWRSIVCLSFPYYILSAGVTAIAQQLSQVWDWQIPVLVMLAMYGVYRSYAATLGI